MTEIRIPKPGEAITEAELTEIHVPDGGTVTEGKPLYAIATDKAEMDIEAPASGVVTWKVKVGGTYPVGELVAVIT
ncbi:biotin/lipoyl-containing protein [Mycobacterium shimoidei]|uniref:biotin/lipoyl-containing protein n=1 Tax=Mycobacterium shimoidei TaxID=29313 RepID=UPI0008496E46|nr:biotin/lipoyl-containing protein [Mycobacterium shimoidei]MCV7257186.1 dihydrolipoamide acyltransferase [Mycobacterium shimoidei]ODR14466.1 dihydrolipoamide acyltransferase [Mycobacterium shimoidei]ORW80542.1 dihydrolipoamide acyltransferase [Mycobacterium shimoidei]